MQARSSPPSSMAAHHRRLMASCAEGGCPQVRQRSGATLSARTVGESSCMSKSVEAPSQEPDSERQGPTNRMSAAMFSGSPHSTRGTTSDRTDLHVTCREPLAASASWLRPARRSWRKSKLAILSVTPHHHPQGQKVHLHRAGY